MVGKIYQIYFKLSCIVLIKKNNGAVQIVWSDLVLKFDELILNILYFVHT